LIFTTKGINHTEEKIALHMRIYKCHAEKKFLGGKMTAKRLLKSLRRSSRHCSSLVISKKRTKSQRLERPVWQQGIEELAF
jgi:hypothetical protein